MATMTATLVETKKVVCIHEVCRCGHHLSLAHVRHGGCEGMTDEGLPCTCQEKAWAEASR